jgi:hypothetical protein
MFTFNPKAGQPARAQRRSRLLSTAIVFGLAFSSFAGAAIALPSPGAQQQAAVSFDQQKAVLSQYGQFTSLPEYGEVWVPSALPQGWHPYPPCNWVFEKTLGWYYDDKTPWGAIVHHYGRWTNHPQLGWVWVPGQEFSPGWVVWRTSTDWVGWAPLPPDSDLQTISAGDFDTDKDWIFVAARDFGAKCGAQIQATPQISRDTQVVREVRYVGGIFVPVFPTYIVAPLVIDLHIGWFPWSPGFIGGIFNAWNFIWNNIEINVVVNTCLPKVLPMQKLPVAPINSNPPPPPGGGGKPPQHDPPRLPPRVDNPPQQLPPIVNNPPTRVFNPPPIVVQNPPPRVVVNNPPPIFTPPVIRPPVTDPCFRARCGGPVVGGNGGGKPIDGGIGNGETRPRPVHIPPVFGGGRGPVFTNVGHQADVGPVSVHPAPVFTGRSVAVGGIGAAGMGAGVGGIHGGGFGGGFGGGGFGRFR